MAFCSCSETSVKRSAYRGVIGGVKGSVCKMNHYVQCEMEYSYDYYSL